MVIHSRRIFYFPPACARLLEKRTDCASRVVVRRRIITCPNHNQTHQPKMHKIIHLSLLLFLLASYSAQAQTLLWDKKADNVIEQSKRLIVVLIDSTDLPNDKKFKKNPDLIRAYGKHVVQFNQMIQAPIREHWRLTEQIDFMTVQEFAAFKNKASTKDEKETLVMVFNIVNYQFLDASIHLSKEDITTFTVEKGRPDYDSKQSVWLFALKNVRPYQGNQILPYPSFFSCRAAYENNRWYLTTADLSFAVENIQDMLALYAKGERNLAYMAFDPANRGKLAEKTLVIPADFLVQAKDGKTTITEAEIKKSYPWPWRVATLAEIDSAILHKDAGLAILCSTRLSHSAVVANGCYFWAVDAADARTILGYSTPGSKNIGVAVLTKEDNFYDLNVRRVEEIVKNARR